ncbi:glycosyl hydrolase [Phlyctema vagabunda]|uniref:Glycosyl hydrolase n=1 Tax=Phlyctema vagabunda TaxID=108571 RepID=A0ABR4P6Q3_9HELO
MAIASNHPPLTMLWLLTLMPAGAVAAQVVGTGLYTFVDPLIGTVGPTPGSAIAGGNSFPGASLPWAMAKAGIDTSYIGVPNGTAVDANAGFTPLGNVTAISMMHVSGSGGVPTYGLVSQMPIYGNLDGVNLADNMTYWQNRSLEAESSTVGLFNTTLLNGVEIAITSSNHSALMRYTFPTSPAEASIPGTADANDVHVLVDLTHVLPGYGTQSYSQKFLHGDLHLRASNASTSPSYFGSATYTGGWPQAESHTLHFCGNFSVPHDSPLEPTSAYVQSSSAGSVTGAGTFSWPYNPVSPPSFSTRPLPVAYNDVKSYAGNGMGIGALFSWSAGSSPRSSNSSQNVLEAKIGISYISAEQACQHLEAELPSSLTFEDIVQQSREIWEEKVLNKVEIVDDGSPTSQNTTLKRMLYSALYQNGLQPTDKTGENPYWTSDDSKPYYDDHYTLWDTYRTVLPLYHLIFTDTYARVISGLISIFTEEGYLPAGRAANWNGRVQGGTHADMVLADAYVKSVVTPSGTAGLGELGPSIDWEEAYRAMVKDANVLPERNMDSVAFDGATKEGRGALDEYLPLHFITRNHTRSISRGVEYPQNDYALWSVATGLGKDADEITSYGDRATWWENQWNPTANTTLTGVGTFTGFPGARNFDGSWNFTAYDPLTCGGAGCGWSGDIYEAKVWETAFAAAPHDMGRIIALMGGDDAFVRRLDASFLPGFGTSVGANNDAGSSLYNPGNEPSFSTSFLYNYVPGMQWKTVNQSRSIVDNFYSDAKNGYPGNIDGGALPSWLVFNLLGFYPVASQPVYLLSAPFFSSLKIHLFQNTTLHIRANGLSPDYFYPQSVTLNGAPLNTSWISHAQLAAGGELLFEMGAEPAAWDVGERPPSMSGW